MIDGEITKHIFVKLIIFHCRCTVCDTKLEAGKSEIRRHSATLKHTKNMDTLATINRYLSFNHIS